VGGPMDQLYWRFWPYQVGQNISINHKNIQGLILAYILPNPHRIFTVTIQHIPT
jgi:hypothetical protein